jgi:hypothetical protein
LHDKEDEEMSGKRIFIYAAVVVLLMTMAPALFGQAFTSLSGVVTDPRAV